MCRNRHGWLGLLTGAALVASGCGGEPEVLVLPPATEVTDWYGEGTEAGFNGNLLEITGPMAEDHLRRGGELWARSGAYFFLFNVHVRDLLESYPDIAGVRVRTVTQDGEEIAVVTLTRADMNEYRWREALAHASQAQTEGTRNPRLLERLINFGEKHTRYSYTELAH